MEDNYEQLYENQVLINEGLTSHIEELNKMIEEQLCIPDTKPTRCDLCTFNNRYMNENGVEINPEIEWIFYNGIAL